MGRNDYISVMFTPFESSFNQRKTYTDEVLKTYQLPMGNNRALQNRYSYLVSHLSNDDGVVGFQTLLDSAYLEIAEIVYVDTMTTVGNIQKALLNDSLTITYSNGRVGKVKNMFDFSSTIQEQKEINKN